MKKHAEEYWAGIVRREDIKVTKLDFCQDLKGSFIPDNWPEANRKIKERLQQFMDAIIERPDLHIFPQGPDGTFTVKHGANILRTSFQYDVVDKDKTKLMTIKFYDKSLDLMGREGSKTVGSRFSKILGSNSTQGILEESVRLAQHTGLTRVEISLNLNHSEGWTLMDRLS